MTSIFILNFTAVCFNKRNEKVVKLKEKKKDFFNVDYRRKFIVLIFFQSAVTSLIVVIQQLMNDYKNVPWMLYLKFGFDLNLSYRFFNHYTTDF